MASETILARIPHRPPFLFVDAIVAEDAETITTRWCPPADAPFFAGHYPGHPIVPGVLIMEMIFQSAALYFAGQSDEGELEGTHPVLTRVSGGRFKRMVRPDEELEAHLTLTEALGPARYMRAKVRTADGALVTSLEFAVAAAQA